MMGPSSHIILMPFREEPTANWPPNKGTSVASSGRRPLGVNLELRSRCPALGPSDSAKIPLGGHAGHLSEVYNSRASACVSTYAVAFYI
jgi:hypothetical protein